MVNQKYRIIIHDKNGCPINGDMYDRIPWFKDLKTLMPTGYSLCKHDLDKPLAYGLYCKLNNEELLLFVLGSADQNKFMSMYRITDAYDTGVFNLKHELINGCEPSGSLTQRIIHLGPTGIPGRYMK